MQLVCGDISMALFSSQRCLLHGLPHTARSTREADETPAVGAERSAQMITSAIECMAAWSYHTDTATTPLATSTKACRFQDCRLGIPVSDRSHACLSGRRLPARHWCQCLPTRRSALSVAHTTTSATGALQQPDHICGTCYHSTWDCVIALDNLSGR